MYYFHSIAVKAGYNSEKCMAYILNKHFTPKQIGNKLGKHAGVYAISTAVIIKWLKSFGYNYKRNKGGRHRNVKD